MLSTNAYNHRERAAAKGTTAYCLNVHSAIAYCH